MGISCGVGFYVQCYVGGCGVQKCTLQDAQIIGFGDRCPYYVSVKEREVRKIL